MVSRWRGRHGVSSMVSFRTTIIGVLLICAVLVRVALFSGGVRGSDAYAYAHQAYNIATGQYDVTMDKQYYGFRYAVLLPTALAYAWFGVADWSSAFFPLLASLGTLLLLVWLGTALFDEQTGLFAGGCYVFFPLDLPAATLLGPDSFIPFLSTAAFLACWLACGEQSKVGRQTGCYLLSGLCIGLAIQARESSVLLLGSLICLILIRRVWSLKPLFILVGCMIPLAAEMGYYWAMTGDLFYRQSVIQQLNDLYAFDAAMATPSQTYFVGGPTSWGYYPAAMLGWDLGGLAWFSFFIYAALGGIVIAAWRGELQRIVPVLAWIAVPFLYLEFGSVSLWRYVPLPKVPHYMSVISGAMVLLSAYGVVTLFRHANCLERGPQLLSWVKWRIVGMVFVVAGLAGTSLYGTYRVLQNGQDDARPYERVAAMVEKDPTRPIYVTHPRWILFLNYHLRYQTGINYYSHHQNFSNGRLRNLKDVEDWDHVPPAYVVLHDRYLYFDTVGKPINRAGVLSDLAQRRLSTWRIIGDEKGKPSYNSFKLLESDGVKGQSMASLRTGM